MKDHIILIAVLLLILSSCRNSGGNSNKFEIWAMESIEHQVQQAKRRNEELYRRINKRDTVFESMISETLDNLTSLQEYAIESSGGYREPIADRTNIYNDFRRDPSVIMRNNPYGITKDYLNRIPNYLEGKGLRTGFIVMDLYDDPIYSASGRRNKDWFELAFSDQNAFQAIAVISDIKLYVLDQETQYILAQLD